jgi:hypothetical protein
MIVGGRGQVLIEGFSHTQTIFPRKDPAKTAEADWTGGIVKIIGPVAAWNAESRLRIKNNGRQSKPKKNGSTEAAL